MRTSECNAFLPQTGTVYCVIQCSGYLAYASADLLNYLSIIIGSRRLIALFLCTPSYDFIKGKFLSRTDHRSINSLRCQTHIGIAVAFRGCVGGKSAQSLIFLLGCSRADFRLHLTSLCFKLCVKPLLLQCRKYIRCQLFLINGKAWRLTCEYKRSLFFVIFVDRTVPGLFVPFSSAGSRLSCRCFLQPVQL